MRQSELFTKVRKEAPSDEEAKNAKLLIRAGFIHKEMAGVYSFLPLGWTTFKRIKNIIREEMNKIGGKEILMSSMQDRSIWEATDRWDDEKIDNWFKTSLKNGNEVGLAFTHEEPLIRLLMDQVSSHKDLPLLPYHFQVKFRNEERAKSGILRTREFIMKDLYSVSKSEEEDEEIYRNVVEAYAKIFERAGIAERTLYTYASGGVFAEFSNEFQTITEAGEDTIYVCQDCNLAINKEIIDRVNECQGCGNKDLSEASAVEVGNVFHLGTKYSEALGLVFKDEEGNTVPAVMGSYGIGIARLMGVIVELYGEEDLMVWPEEVSPFKAHVLEMSSKDGAVREMAEKIVQKLADNNVSVLYDDRDLRAGEKFAESDIIGIPHRIIVGEKSLEKNKFEYINRFTDEKEELDIDSILSLFGESASKQS